MSVSTLQPVTSINVQRASINAEGKEAGFLTFNYLNKHARVRVSPQPLDLTGVPGRANFLAVSNSHGWFAAITRSTTNDLQLSCSPLSHLQQAFASNPPAGVEEISFKPQRTFAISGTPNLLSLACNETKLLIAFAHGPISVYDCLQLFTPGTGEFPPVHTFPGNLPSQQMESNPGDMADLVAVLREGDNPPVQVLNVQTFQPVCGWNVGQTPESTPCALSWSPRGKQLAIAMQSGDIITYSPTAPDSPKATISRPQNLAGNRVLSATWLANPTFFTVFAPAGPLEPKTPQSHYVVSFDSKSNTATDISLSAPYFPFPGLRNPGAFVLLFRNWDPVKFLVVVGDSTSQDIGSIGCYLEASGEVWYNLNVDEAYTPSLPLDKDMNDTILLGLDLDLTAINKYDYLSPSGEKVEVPPPPIMYAYSSDGTFIGWHVVNGTAKMYPGMKNAAAEPPVDAPMSVTPAPSTMNEAPSSGFGLTRPSTGFGGPGKPSQPTFGSTGFGRSSDTQPAFSPGTAGGGFAAFANGGSLSGFSQPSFGSTGFGQSSQPSTFSQQPSPFGQTQTSSVFGQSSPSTFGQTNQPPGFGQTDQPPSFLKPASFDQSAFGSRGTPGSSFGAFTNNTTFGSPSPLQAPDSSFSGTQGGARPSEMIREVSMGIDSGEGSFGGLSLGSGGDTKPAQEKGQGGSFGDVETQPSSTPTVSAFGSSIISTGFSAFSNWNQNTLETPSSDSQKHAPKPATGFGQTGFGAKTTPAFGQPAFGSTFGQTSFGPPTPSAPLINPSSGGFGAWSSSTPSLLARGGPTPTKPAWSLDKNDSQTEAKPKPESVFAPPEKPDPAAIRDQPKQRPSTPGKSQQDVTTPSPASSPDSPKPLTAIGTTSSSAIGQSPSPSPFGKPAADKPSSAGGVFANLKQSTFSLGDSVFGAMDKSSPFFRPAQATPTTTPVKVSAFDTPATTSSTPSTSTPVFGRSSVFGNPTPSTTPKTPVTSTPVTGGFSAFASTTSPFGKVEGAGKSFSDLLKTPDNVEEPIKTAQRPSVFSLPNSPDKGEQSKTLTKSPIASSTVFSLANLTPPPDLASLGLDTPSSDVEHPSGDEYSEDGSSQQSGEEGEEEVAEGEEVEDGEETEEYGSDSESGSFLDESLSYEDLGAHLDEEEIERPHELSPVAEETTLPLESGDEGDTTQSPRKKRPTPDPTKIALPASRESSVQPDSKSSSGSPSVTPKPTNANLPSPEATSTQQSREPSTTPPSTPAKLNPNLPVPSTSSYGIGLGRPPAKPTRSSPLTADPISGQDAPKQLLTGVMPSLPKPRPASPKVAFGQWNTPDSQRKSDLSKIQPFSLGMPPTREASEPTKKTLFNTSSISGTASLFGKPGEPPVPSLGTAFTHPQPTAGGGLSNQQDNHLTRPPPNNLFGNPFAPAQRGSLSNSTEDGAVSGGFFGRPTAESSPKETLQAPGLPSKSLSVPRIPETQAKAAFLTVTKENPTPPPVTTPARPAQLLVHEPSPEEGLQAECLYQYLLMNKDIEELKGAVQRMPQRKAELLKPKVNLPQPPPGISKDGLEDAQRWSLHDAPAYGKAMKSLHTDITALKESWRPFHQVLGEIEGDLLRASTRREEIARFSKAINNHDFARMLKTRNLGPEHLEKQTRLRKQLRNIRDRVEKLEGHLQIVKKKLEREKSGKVGFKAPTLDTINRTYRNIDIAIARQMEDINKLSSRMSKLDFKSFQKPKSPSSRDKRLPDRSIKGRKTVNITSSIAAMTATTLNAERSAYTLKRVLLSVRDKPLLNTKASPAASARVEFRTPQKLGSGLLGSTGSASVTPLPPLPVTLPTTTSPSPLSTSGGTRRTKHHAKSAWSSKKPDGESSPSPAPSTFDWGPPPASAGGQKPLSSLPFSLLPSTPPPGSSNRSSGLPFALR